MSEELKPCPFCGGAAKIDRKNPFTGPDSPVLVYVRCTKCGSQGRAVDDRSIGLRPGMNPVDYWNQRDVESIKVELDGLANEQRYALLSQYCHACGSNDTSCTCMRDD